jgi:dTDP-glucose 4,6-dehydratase
MARLLVTGGAGFIGSNFVHYWVTRHPNDRLVVLDALTYAGNLANIQSLRGRPQYRFVHGNICNTELVKALLVEEQLDTIVHFAAESHVDRSIVDPDEFIMTNVLGTHSLLKAARHYWLEERRDEPHRFHHVSTDEVYGSLAPDDLPFSESTPYAPNSPYAASKAASDHLVRAYHRTYGLCVTISNCSNNYGPYQFPEKLLPLAISQALDGKPIPVYGDGRNVRDWIHVTDHCAGIDRILSHGKAGQVYNLGSHGECENLTLIGMLCETLDNCFARSPVLRQQFPRAPSGRADSLIQFVKDRPGHDRRYAISSEKVERQLGFKPSVSLSDGLNKTVEWYLANEDWWRALQRSRSKAWDWG